MKASTSIKSCQLCGIFYVRNAQNVACPVCKQINWLALGNLCPLHAVRQCCIVQVYGTGYREALLSNKPGSSGRTVKSIMKALGALSPSSIHMLLGQSFAGRPTLVGMRTRAWSWIQAAHKSIRTMLVICALAAFEWSPAALSYTVLLERTLPHVCKGFF